MIEITLDQTIKRLEQFKSDRSKTEEKAMVLTFTSFRRTNSKKFR